MKGNQTEAIPQGWITASIEEALTLIRGISFPKDAKQTTPFENSIACLRTANVQEQTTWEDLWFVSKTYVSRQEQIVELGDILISMANSLELLGKVSHINTLPYEATLGTFIANLRCSNHLNNKYIFYYLSTSTFKNNVRALASTTTNISNISAGKLKTIEILLPPLAEQHRIVAKIEELFSELDKGVENLKTALAQLKVYGQALLKHAFEGKLTEKWRVENLDKLESADQLLARIKAEREAHYEKEVADWKAAVAKWETDGKNGKKPTKPKAPKELPPLTEEELAELPELPEGWAWVKLGHLNVGISDGPFGSSLKTQDYLSSGIRVIRLENIGFLEFIDEKTSFISERKYHSLKKHRVGSGDLIFASFVTESVRVVVLPTTVIKAINKADCFAIKVFGRCTSNHYLAKALSDRRVFRQLRNSVHGVGRPRINTTQLKDTRLPICSFSEQEHLNIILESQFSSIAHLQEEITQRINQATLLRQSILRKAFSGKLVPQDPSDEPASVLLERIKAEKEKNGLQAPKIARHGSKRKQESETLSFED